MPVRDQAEQVAEQIAELLERLGLRSKGFPTVGDTVDGINPA